jgi:hypothetical protein
MQLTTYAIALAVFVAAFIWRFLDVDFHNDHFYVIAAARQMLHGELPYRDFFDLGEPLQLLFSAIAMQLAQERLLGEAVLSIGFLSLGTALTFLLATRISGSIWLGLFSSVLVVACSLRLLNYQKLVLPPLALWALWRYAEHRTWASLASVAVVSAVSTLFRHDFALYVGAATLVTLLTVHLGDGWLQLVRRTAAYVALVAVFLLPWLIFVQLNGGTAQYVGDIRAFGEREAARLGTFAFWKGTGPKLSFDEGAPLVVLHPPPLARLPEVRVRWAPRVGNDRRESLERRHGLVALGGEDSRTRLYALSDTSTENLRRLVNDDRVEDTDQIDRTHYRPLQLAEPLWVGWHRAIPLLRLQHLLPGLVRESNAVPWLFTVVNLLPFFACASLAYRHFRTSSSRPITRIEAAMVLSTSVLLFFSTQLLVRKPFEGRTMEVFGTATILGSWLVANWLGKASATHRRTHGSFGLRTLGGALAAGGRFLAIGSLLAVTFLSVAVVVGLKEQLLRSPLFHSPSAVLDRLERSYANLTAWPPLDTWAAEDAVGGRALARYAARCTAPEDRILVMSWTLQIYYYSGRLFGGSHAFIAEGYWSSPQHQERSLRRLREQSVPLVLLPAGMAAIVRTEFDDLHRHLSAHYDLARESTFGGDKPDDRWRVLVDRRRVPTGTYEPFGLPCFA